MTDNRLLDLVDDRDFRTLFVEELGWNNPDRPDLTVEVDDDTFTLQQVAGYKGLRIWHCPVLPPRKIQRQIDVLVGQDNQERLVIFTNEQRQEWRWPRRAQLGSANAKLLAHEHIVGDRSTHLTQRLQAIELDFDEDLSLVALLDRMRDAFDHEAESASVAAARLMGTLYTELETCGVGEHDATLLLARLLFLLFGDDADMWKPEGLFEKYLSEHTTVDNLHKDLQGLFDVLDTDEKKRALPADSPYAPFRYINGGLFHDHLRLLPLNSAFREALIEACKFDWSIISPAVFGSMFQTVKSREARRAGGEHYTTEENILKTIRPLFLDEYRGRLERAWNDKAQLTKLHNELGRLRFLDPACGCGNFLIVAYKELRALELELLTRRRELDMTEVSSRKVERAQLSLDVTGDIKVTLDHFYGIEIEEWPVRIAETAMLLVDHLANQKMALEFGVAPDRLPIEISPTIIHANSLHIDWSQVIAPTDDVIILGNPPFQGDNRDSEQTKDLQAAWGEGFELSRLDYVTAWHAKALKYFGSHNGVWAYVTTNSIVQGDQVPRLFGQIFNAGWDIKFAHRTFRWTSEAKGEANVHCVIVGFTRGRRFDARLFDYETPRSEPKEIHPSFINAYLVDGPNILVQKRTKPITSWVPEARKGSEPTGSAFIITGNDIDEFLKDPVAAKYVRPYLGADELLNGKKRWCLWMKDLDPADVTRSSLLSQRISAIKQQREKSKSPEIRPTAATPHLFRIDKQPEYSYVAIPRHFSNSYKYCLVERFSPDVICGDANFYAEDPKGLLFGLISSSMFITWQRTVGGRIKSDPRFANTLTWNTFPVPQMDKSFQHSLISAGEDIIKARKCYPDKSLEAMYSGGESLAHLTNLHESLDLIVDQSFGSRSRCKSERERQKLLFQAYVKSNQ
ncbi:DNA methyltransferase [Rhodococcus pyridinivorans]|uniref:DNA methyltransferase n=1 Tax=Rhodococcus pyridinivorans TaxID=103816 RepID=UPI00110E9548|nr:DNA methyltransferase [Rhodococcus pyridinivorans]